MEHLHKHDIFYRDLKPENILVDELGFLKLTDFGLSKDGMYENGGLTESFCGTSEYLAPEIIKDKQYGFTVDWYSMGLVIYEMLGAMNPFKTGDDIYNIMKEIIDTIDDITKENSNITEKFYILYTYLYNILPFIITNINRRDYGLVDLSPGYIKVSNRLFNFIIFFLTYSITQTNFL